MLYSVILKLDAYFESLKRFSDSILNELTRRLNTASLFIFFFISFIFCSKNFCSELNFSLNYDSTDSELLSDMLSS